MIRRDARYGEDGLETYRFEYRMENFIGDTVSQWYVHCVSFPALHPYVLRLISI